MPRIYGDTLDKKLATLERVADQYDTDIKRLWKRMSQTPQNYVGAPFVAQNAQQATGTSSTTTTTTTTTTPPATTTGTTTTGTTTTAPPATTTGTTTPPAEGSTQWVWTMTGQSFFHWEINARSCVTGYIPTAPGSAGNFDGELTTTTCVADASSANGFCLYYWEGSTWSGPNTGDCAGTCPGSSGLGSGAFAGETRVLVCTSP